MNPRSSSRVKKRGASRRTSRPAHAARAPVLYLENISVSFDGFKALNDLTLYIDDGELRCIIGPNGAGKTTMMDVITGKTRPDSGTAFFGQTLDLTRMSEYEIASDGIGRKFQKPTVFPEPSVFEIWSWRCAPDKGVWPSLFARLSGEQRDRIDAALHTVMLVGQRDARGGIVARSKTLA